MPVPPGVPHRRTHQLRRDRPVLRRDQRTLQVGLGPRAVRFGDGPEVQAMLADLDPYHRPVRAVEGPVESPVDRPAASSVTAELLDRLAAGGHLEPRPDASDARPDVPGRGRTAAATAELRDDRWVVPRSVGLVVADTESRARLAPLLEGAGLHVDESRPVAWLVVTGGPARRSLVDDLVRAGTPHLVVESIDGVRRVGPFVVPGRTACLRCVDAHGAEQDPRHPFLLDQAASAAARRPCPPDPVTDVLALAWAVRDLAAFSGGAEPSTWSATFGLGEAGDPRATGARRDWLRHPHCGCAWDDLLVLA